MTRHLLSNRVRLVGQQYCGNQRDRLNPRTGQTNRHSSQRRRGVGGLGGVVVTSGILRSTVDSTALPPTLVA